MSKKITKTGVCGLAAVGLMAAPTMMIVTGCSSQQAVAATVNGENIDEQTITDYIQNMRETSNLTNDQDWAQWLVDNGYDVDSIRDQAIDYYTRMKVIEQDAASHDVSVSDDEVNEQFEQIKSYYNYSDDDLLNALKQAGYNTLDSYKEYIKYSMLQDRLMNAVITDSDEVSDEDILDQANNYKSIINGSKQLKVIAIDKNDKQKADDVDGKAKSGSDFDALASDNTQSTDYDGWDVMTASDDAINQAVSNMNKGDVSDVLEGSSYYFVVKVVDVCNVPDDGYTSVDQVPQAYVDTFRDTLSQSKQSSDFQTYVSNLESSADKTTNPRPDKLPYDVSLDGIEPSENANVSSSSNVSVDEDGNVVTSDDGTTTVTTTTDDAATGSTDASTSTNETK